MIHFVRTDFLAGGFLKTHTVREFADAAAAIDFATSQIGEDVISVKIYTNGESA